METLRVTTFNPNSWNSVKDQLGTLHGQVIMIQEMRQDKDQVLALSALMKSKGFYCVTTECTQGPSGSPSAGVAIFSKLHLNAIRLSTAVTSIVFKHHCVAMPIRFKKLGAVVFYSLYLVSGAGFHSVN